MSIWIQFAVCAILIGIAGVQLTRYEMRQVAQFADQESDNYPGISLRQAIFRYSMAALFLSNSFVQYH